MSYRNHGFQIAKSLSHWPFVDWCLLSKVEPFVMNATPNCLFNSSLSLELTHFIITSLLSNHSHAATLGLAHFKAWASPIRAMLLELNDCKDLGLSFFVASRLDNFELIVQVLALVAVAMLLKVTSLHLALLQT